MERKNKADVRSFGGNSDFLRRDPESGGDAHGVGELVVRGHHGVEEAGSEDGEGGAGSAEELGYVRCHFGGEKDVSGDQCFESEAGPSRSAGNRNLGRFGIKRLHLEAKAMTKSVSGAQKQRKALVRKESTDTQEHGPNKQKGMDVNKDEDELTFVAQCGQQFGWKA